MSLTVSKHERGIVRVFALSMTDAEAKALRDNAATSEDAPLPQAEALGIAQVDSTFTEVFPVADISEIGLTGYLEQGNGIDGTQLAPDRAKLDALEGWVFLVYSSAFGGADCTLSPSRALTLIGSYSEPGVDWSSTQTLTSESATGSAAPARKTPSDAAMSGRIATLVLLFLFALVGVMIWVAG